MTTSELQIDAPGPVRTHTAGYWAALAVSQADVLAAQRLRDQVLRPDEGARTVLPAAPGLQDVDDRCDHLIVWHRPPAGPAQAVATCRLFPPHSNDSYPRGSALSADREFGLMPLERLLDSTVEVSRGCLHPAHSAAALASLLWGGIARYMRLTGYRYLLGCASMDLRDGGRNAASFWDLALTRCLAPAERRCRPRRPVAIGGVERAGSVQVPALLAGCLRLGAQICGPPAHNEMARTADFLVLLDLQLAEPRHLRRFLGRDG